MAAIGSIRKRSGLLVFIIGLSIVGFLLMDALNSNTSVLRGGRKDSIGVVNGDKILYTEFMRKLDDAVSNMQNQMGGQGITDEQRNMLRNQVWNDMVGERLESANNEKLGLAVTADELAEITIGNNPHPYIVQSFTNQQTGQFDASQVRLFLQSLDNDEQGAEPGSKRKMWTNFEKELKKDELRQKYVNLITKGLSVPTWLAENAYENQLITADFKYVQLAYSGVKDSDVKPTDDELKSYLKKNAKKYVQEEETRRFEYVTFAVVPSAQDSFATLDYLNEKLPDFEKGEKTSDDSIFTKIYSEDPFRLTYLGREDIADAGIAESLLSAPIRSIVGPYIEDGKYKYAKITDRKLVSDSARVSEIVFSFANIQTQGEADAKQHLFDSVFTVLDSLKGNFAQMAFAFSDDANSKMQGGDIGWVQRNTKPVQYNDLIFYKAKKGEVHKTATQNELILFMVTDDRPSKLGVQAAYFTKTIMPSPETERNIYANATKFASDNQTEEKFKASAQKLNPQTADNLRKNDFNVYGLGNARDVVRWAFNAKKGDVSSTMSVDGKYVIACLTTVSEKGTPALEAVRDHVEFDYARDKRAEILSKKLEDAKAASIEEMASKLGTEAVSVSGASFSNPSLNGSIFEPDVVAAAVGASPNKLVLPIKGNSGVYAIQVTNKNEPPKATDFTSYIQNLKSQIQNKGNRVTEVMRKLADVEDFRFDFF